MPRRLLRDRERFIDWNRPALDALRQRLSPTSSITRNSGPPVLDAVNGRDVGMIQRCQYARFALETRDAFGIMREGSGSNLIATLRPSFESVA